METNSQKHLGLLFDNRLSSEDHLKMILNIINKTIGLLHKLQNILPRLALITIYKTFIRPHLSYGDIIYDQVYNASLHQKLELLQYNAYLAITGAMRATSKEKLYEEFWSPFNCVIGTKNYLVFINSSSSSISIQTNPFKKFWLCY